VSADIVRLSDYRNRDDCDNDAIEGEIDLVTAVDVAIRDLREILLYWGSGTARQRAEECELMLRRAYSGCVIGQSDFR
jgi:hypothetical protein